jgi:hypothetical protein
MLISIAGHRWHAPVTPATEGNINRRIMVQTILGKRQDPISNITRVKRTGGLAQVVQCLPRKHKALSQNPNTSRGGGGGNEWIKI